MLRDNLHADAVRLLQKMIAIPSYSKDENATALLLQGFLQQKGVPVNRLMNNVWVVNKYFDASKPTLLLNSHHDTVKPNSTYTRNPFDPAISGGKLYGLGSNDAGGCLVSLLSTFLFFYEQKDMKYNIVFAATAEEEISGVNGVEALLPLLPEIDAAIVGEPTLLEMAIAEKGLLVIDCTTAGVTGHAARDEGDNAICHAIEDIIWFRSYSFPKVSEFLGPVKMTVTILNAGTQHNVIPDKCTYTVDVRVNECYTHDELLDIITSNVKSAVVARSKRLKSTAIDVSHPLVKAGEVLGLGKYGSPTISDKALMPFPALKIGPGDSARSHTADEYIYINEIEEGIDTYIKILEQLI